jgi:hypothetical protein
VGADGVRERCAERHEVHGVVCVLRGDNFEKRRKPIEACSTELQDGGSRDPEIRELDGHASPGDDNADGCDRDQSHVQHLQEARDSQ